MVTLKSAAVVRREQKNSVSEEEEKYLEKIANAIDKESRGINNTVLISIPGYLIPKITWRLQNLGYIVSDVSNQMDGDSIRIDW